MSQKPSLPSTDRPAAANWRRLGLLRGAVITSQCAAFAVACGVFELALPVVPIAGILGLWALLVAAACRRRSRSVGDGEMFVHLLLDVAALTALLYFSGGYNNPAVSLYLLPLTIAATALPRRYAYGMAAVTVACSTLLLLRFTPLPQVHPQNAHFSLHLIGMWLTFVLSAGLVGYFIAGLAASLRERDRLLAAAREKALRDEQILALGMLAAGAAHELGTPLTTIAILVRELEHEHAASPDLAQDLATLRAQVENCKRIISDLLASAGRARAEAASRQGLDEFLDGVLAKWRQLRPGVTLDCRWDGIRPPPQILAERTLSQILISLINNAADASPQGIELEGRWDAAELILEIHDRGAGIAPEIARRVGELFFTTKAERGTGLGLFLAQAAIERLGGRVSLCNRNRGGVCTRIVLPLTPLSVAPA